MKHISYFLPKKIVIAEGEIYNEQSLLRKKTSQIGLNESDVATVNGKCRLVFDFGEEICGCVRILVPRRFQKLRVISAQKLRNPNFHRPVALKAADAALPAHPLGKRQPDFRCVNPEVAVEPVIFFS